ncbi:putative pre-16S rRNA nuclease [bioreactor metagenome]|uniref:Putative pre-16S rRNA nuclease n=1 Tax=bioreactor metagenome TaxID=1076179 RepID=A0A645BEI6_9ZZZZ
MRETGKILAVDPGEKNIGLAISDETAMLARPLQVIKHFSKTLDAATIATIASENHATRIVIGTVFGPDNEEIPQTRHARSLAAAVETQTALPIILWDEYGTTNAAKAVLVELGVNRQKRSGHQDGLAAAMILQSYLNSLGENNAE